MSWFSDPVTEAARRDAEARLSLRLSMIERLLECANKLHVHRNLFNEKGMSLSLVVESDHPSIFISRGSSEARIWWCHKGLRLSSYYVSRRGNMVDGMNHTLTSNTDVAVAIVVQLLKDDLMHLGDWVSKVGTRIPISEAKRRRVLDEARRSMDAVPPKKSRWWS